MKDLQEIPIIDLSSIAYKKYEKVDISALGKIAEEFGKAMSQVGFAYLLNHGVDLTKADNVHKLSREFFLLPQEVKQKYKKAYPIECYHGYAGPGDELINETKKNSTELRETWDNWGQASQDATKFPTEVPGVKEAFDDIAIDCNDLVKKLLLCMGKYLNLEEEHFFVNQHRFLDDPTIWSNTQFRSAHYFPLDEKDKSIPNAIRCAEHCDWGTITLLFQDMVGGLEVRKTDGSWIHAVPIKDTIIVNCAQLMELWSGGIYPATPHRVRIVDDDRLLKSSRQSLIYFVSPDGAADVKPIVTFPPGKPEFEGREPVNADDHYKRLIRYAIEHNSY